MKAQADATSKPRAGPVLENVVLAALLGLALIAVIALQPRAAVAAVEAECGTVTKTINGDRAQATVLVVQGDVSCSLARSIIRRALSPSSGYWGNVAGWHCDPKGSVIYAEVCEREQADDLQVIKSGHPHWLRH